MRALRVILAIEAASLAVGIGLVLHSERRTSFPSSLTVTAPARASAAVPVSVDLGLAGSTTTTVAVTSRGGHARRLLG